MAVVTGSKGYAKYGIYSSGAWRWYDFGDGVVVNNIGMRREIIRIASVGCRKPVALANGRFSANWSIGFVLTDSANTTLNALTTNLGILNTAPKAIGLEIVADGISYKAYDTSTNEGWAYASRLSLSSRVGEVVRATVEGIAKGFSVGTGSATGKCTAVGTPITFAEGSVTISGVSDVGYVRAFDVTLNSNIEPIYALGDDKLVDVYGRIFGFTGRMTVVLKGIDIYAEFLSGDDTSITLQFSSNEKITLNPSRIEEITASIRPGEVVEATVAFVGADVTIV